MAWRHREDAESRLAALSPDYTDSEIAHIWDGNDFAERYRLQPVLSLDLSNITKLDCPLIIFAGRHEDVNADVAAVGGICGYAGGGTDDQLYAAGAVTAGSRAQAGGPLRLHAGSHAQQFLRDRSRDRRLGRTGRRIDRLRQFFLWTDHVVLLHRCRLRFGRAVFGWFRRPRQRQRDLRRLIGIPIRAARVSGRAFPAWPKKPGVKTFSAPGFG